MPSADAILSGLTAIANDAQPVAWAWHAVVGVFLAAVASGWRPRERHLAMWLSLPAVSVALLALAYGNPFNGATFGALAAIAVLSARRRPTSRVRLATWPAVAAGAAFVVFGLVYPHFTAVESAWLFAVAAPTSLIPCPTLSLLVGITLAVEHHLGRLWATTLTGWGLVYGLVGVLVLGVTLDLVLLVAATALAAARVGAPQAGLGGARTNA